MTLQQNFFTFKLVMYRHLAVHIKNLKVGPKDYTYDVCSNSRLETYRLYRWVEYSVICCGGSRNSSVGIPEPGRSPGAIEFLGSVYCFDAPSHIYTLDHIKFYRYEIHKFTQDSRQMFLLVLFYFFESQFVND